MNGKRIKGEGMAELIVCARKEVPFHILPGKKYDIIAFYDEAWDRVQCPPGSLGRLLELHIADVLQPGDPKSMDNAAALRIKVFADEAMKNADALIVCCAAGMSRSPAVAAAVMRGSGLDDGCIWDDARYSPNPLCYEMVLNAYGIAPDNLDALKERSRLARYNKINDFRF